MSAGDEELPATAADDAVGVLLARVLELPVGEQVAALEELCRKHTSHAREIRSRYRALEAVGLLAQSGGDGSAFPSHLGEFRLVEPLGGGGMGVVYRAVEEPLQREVALKLIRPEHLYFPGARQWFRREVEAIARLQHQGIVPIYRAGEANGIPFFVMELVPGKSLAQAIGAVQRVPQERLRARALAAAVGEDEASTLRGVFALGSWVDACIGIVLQVAEALVHAHARGVIHRDVKPSNIMLTRDGRARLLDFGLAAREGSAKLTRTGVAMGSLAYMAPEQVRGSAVDERSDVYALGVTLYELLTLQEPYYDDSSEVLRAQILRGQPKPIRLLNRKVPWDVETVCLRAMTCEPQHRYRDMGEFAHDLGSLLRREPIRARRPSPWLRARRLVQRHPTAAAIFVLAGLLATAMPTALWLQQRSANAVVRAALARAEDEAETARQTTDFLVGAVRLADPERTLGETFTVRQMIDDAARRLRVELRDQPRVQAALLAAIGRVYENLGLLDDSAALLTEALPMLAALPPSDACDVRVTLARVQRALGRLDAADRSLAVAEANLDGSVGFAARAGLRTERACLAYERGDAEAAGRGLDALEAECRERGDMEAALLEVLRARVHLSTRNEDYLEALRRLPEVEALAARVLGEGSAARASLWHERGRALRAAGDAKAALEAFAAAEAATVRIFGAAHLDVAEVQESAAFALADLQQFEAGRAKLTAAAAIRAAALRPDHPAIARNLTLQGELALGAGDAGEAEALFAKAEEILQRDRSARPAFLASVAGQRMIAAARAGHLEEALDLGERAQARYAALGHEDEDRAAFLERHAFVLLSAGRGDAGRAAAAESLAIRQRLYPGDHPRIAHSLQVLAQACAYLEDYTTALRHSEAALAVVAARPSTDAAVVGLYQAVKAQALAGLARYTEAIAAYDAGLAAMVRGRGSDDRGLIEMLVNCGLCLRSAGRTAEARDRFAEAKRIVDLTVKEPHRLHVTVRRLLGRAMLDLGDPAGALPHARAAASLAAAHLPADDPDAIGAARLLADATAAAEKH